MSAPLAAVTFDAAGTLIEPAEPVAVTYVRAARRHGIAADVESVARSFAAAFASAPPLAFPGVPAERVPAAERAWWHAVVQRALGAAGPALDACVDELLAHYAQPAAWRVFPDVPPALATLRARGLRLAVVSNFDGRLAGLLTGLGLAPSSDAVCWSGAAGAAKPDPAIFRAACASLGAPPDTVLHVGDAVDADAAGARAAGLRAVLLDRDRRRPALPPDVPVIDTLAALPAQT